MELIGQRRLSRSFLQFFLLFQERELKVRGTHKGVTSYVCSVVKKKKREAIDKMTGNHKNQYN